MSDLWEGLILVQILVLVQVLLDSCPGSIYGPGSGSRSGWDSSPSSCANYDSVENSQHGIQ